MRDWRLPENRREAFQRFYSFHLRYGTHPGCVYFALPAIAKAHDLSLDDRAWLAWLNGNTQNPAMSLLLLQEAPHWQDWPQAVAFWNEHFKALDWDTDRRYQKGKFGEATEAYMAGLADTGDSPASAWYEAGEGGWEAAWRYAKGLPHYGRLSAWSGLEFARILLGPVTVPDIGSWMLEDKSGSRSHRNGVALVAGYDSVYWGADDADMLGVVPSLTEFADSLLEEAHQRNGWGEEGPDGLYFKHHPDVGRLTMESALCTYKSWHKPNRRYPNVYADMMYNRLKKAEARFGDRFDILWRARADALPERLLLECNPHDPGLAPIKQNHYLETGQIPVLSAEYDDMHCDLDVAIETGGLALRKDPTWT